MTEKEWQAKREAEAKFIDEIIAVIRKHRLTFDTDIHDEWYVNDYRDGVDGFIEDFERAKNYSQRLLDARISAALPDLVKQP